MAAGGDGRDRGEPGEVTQLLDRWRGGDGDAFESLLPLVYRELRRIAGAMLRNERPGHTLQATALVHEAYLRMVTEMSAVPPSEGSGLAQWSNAISVPSGDQANAEPPSSAEVSASDSPPPRSIT
jgi:ECF sigma factor